MFRDCKWLVLERCVSASSRPFHFRDLPKECERTGYQFDWDLQSWQDTVVGCHFKCHFECHFECHLIPFLMPVNAIFMPV